MDNIFTKFTCTVVMFIVKLNFEKCNAKTQSGMWQMICIAEMFSNL